MDTPFGEDDTDLRGFLKETLEAEGMEVAAVADAAGALIAIGADPPDLVLLDLGLPDLDGLDVLTALRRNGDLPVIGLTGPATVTEHERRVRLKLERDPANPRWIHNVRGVGTASRAERRCDGDGTRAPNPPVGGAGTRAPPVGPGEAAGDEQPETQALRVPLEAGELPEDVGHPLGRHPGALVDLRGGRLSAITYSVAAL